MAAAFDRDDEDVIADVNIIPFVDIVLVLLIIFMVTSTTIVKAALKVDLPKAAAAGESVDQTLNVVMTAEGDLFLDGEPMSAQALAAAVSSVAKDDPNVRVLISADQSLAYGEVVATLDLVKASGVKGFALNLERKASASDRT